MDIDRSAARTIFKIFAGSGAAALIGSFALGEDSPYFDLVFLSGVLGLATGLAGLSLMLIFSGKEPTFKHSTQHKVAPHGRAGGIAPYTFSASVEDGPVERRLTDVQRRALVTTLSSLSGKAMIWAADSERAYARDFAECFVAAKWEVQITYALRGVRHAGFHVHRDPAHHDGAKPVIAAMWAAGFAIDIIDQLDGAHGLEEFTAGLSLGEAS